MKKFVIILTIILARQLYSQDIISGYIQTKRVQPFSVVVGGTTVQVYNYSITVILFTDASKNNPRPNIPINFGDGNTGTFSVLATNNITGINKKTYAGTYTYLGPGNYGVFFLDTFRVEGIRNMANSQIQQFILGATIFANNFNSNNSPPSILFDPINIGGSNQLFYNPSSTDVDGDSLSFEMYICSGANWYLPNNSSINNTSGSFSFTNDTTGKYSFSFRIVEWRKNLSNVYQKIGMTQLDFLANIVGSVGLTALNKNNSKVILYPNPATNKLFISVDNSALLNFDIVIFNSNGQIILESKDLDKINISDFPRGIYIIKISDKNNYSDSFRFIKD
jgi:hypothetical protein